MTFEYNYANKNSRQQTTKNLENQLISAFDSILMIAVLRTIELDVVKRILHKN